MENLLDFLDSCASVQLRSRHEKKKDRHLPQKRFITKIVKEHVVNLRHLSLTNDSVVYLKHREVAARTGRKQWSVNAILCQWRRAGFVEEDRQD